MRKPGTHQFWISVHRYLGLATLGFLLIAAVTGCLLCFDASLDAALNPDLFRATPRSGCNARSAIRPGVAAARFEAGHPAVRVLSFPLHVAPGRTIEASVTARRAGSTLDYDQVFLDPCDGHVVGVRESGPGWDRRHLMEGIYQLHYTLLAGTWGRWLMGLVALGWMIGNFVGLYLTMPPKGPFWKRWKPMWKIDLKARLRRLLLETHRASGLWLLIGVSVLAFTSVCMNFFNEAFIPAVEAVSPAAPSPFDHAPRANRAQTSPSGFANALNVARGAARKDHLHWIAAKETAEPDYGLYGVMFTPDGFEQYRDLGPVTYYVDARSGRLMYVDDPYRDSAGRKLTRALFPLHSGQIIGLPGVFIIFLLGLATAEMCITGFYTWWKKRQSRRAMARSKQAQAPS